MLLADENKLHFRLTFGSTGFRICRFNLLRFNWEESFLVFYISRLDFRRRHENESFFQFQLNFQDTVGPRPFLPHTRNMFNTKTFSLRLLIDSHSSSPRLSCGPNTTYNKSGGKRDQARPLRWYMRLALFWAVFGEFNSIRKKKMLHERYISSIRLSERGEKTNNKKKR